jgi:N-acetylmuramoyl-L-alanine amidase
MVRPGNLFPLLVLLLFCAVARAGDWRLVNYQGRDFVTMRNVADFYELGDYQEAGTALSMGAPGRNLRGTVGSNELYINGLKFILSYPIGEAGVEPIVSRMDLTKVIEPVLRPSRIHDAATIDSVVLDPGHGGYDNGAMSIWGAEKNYALDVALRTKPLLEAQGLKVYMTRTSDEFIPLEDRVRIANLHPAALFVAIHFNSGDPAANGLETYTLAPRGVPSMAAQGPLLSDMVANPGNVRDAENMALACAMHASLIYHARLFDRGIKRARFVVIRDITIPGVLVEGGFLSNPGDAQLIATEQYRDQEAQCIAIAIRNYRNAVNSPAAPALGQGSGVVVRDDANIPAPPPPIAEGPASKPAQPAASPMPPTLSVTPAIAKTEPVIQPPKPAPASPAKTVSAPAAAPFPQAERQAWMHSTVTPIVD